MLTNLSHHRMSTMDRHWRPLGLLLSTAIMVLTIWTPAQADDMGANKSELIRGLLTTVVNIATRKDEVSNPTASNDANAATPTGATPGADASRTIRYYAGSGFVIDPSGLIITNYHVVEGAFEITVMFSDGTIRSGKMVNASRLADIAIVKVETDHPLPAAHWGDSDSLRVGDEVLAAGNPFGVGLSVSAGIVSALNRDIQDSPYDDFIQTDAAINHGNSGGPLFDMQGNVVGVDSTIISPTKASAGIGFAIPSSSAHFVYDQLRTYGWVRPAWIGVKVQAVTRNIADAIALSPPEGSIVSWVLPDGPAQKAGIQIGDVIRAYNGSTPSDDRALLRAIAHTSVGTTISMSVVRDGKELTIPVTVAEWPRDQWEQRDSPTAVFKPKILVPPDLGLSLAALDSDDKAKSGMGSDLRGVMVTRVAPESDPANLGLKSGDVILRVQDKPVAKPDEVLSGFDAARAAKREYVLLLILQKVRDVPGPRWYALRLGPTSD
jgi:serine protease Do